MPIINISMVEGRSAEQKEAMGQAITRAVQETIGAPLDTIKIVINRKVIHNIGWGSLQFLISLLTRFF